MRPPIKKTCPHCGGNSGFEFTEYGVSVTYGVDWEGEGFNCELDATRGAPVYGKCMDCKKRIKIKDYRGY